MWRTSQCSLQRENHSLIQIRCQALIFYSLSEAIWSSGSFQLTVALPEPYHAFSGSLGRILIMNKTAVMYVWLQKCSWIVFDELQMVEQVWTEVCLVLHLNIHNHRPHSQLMYFSVKKILCFIGSNVRRQH